MVNPQSRRCTGHEMEGGRGVGFGGPTLGIVSTTMVYGE